jgi:drug/metabolite transporter (DMT)-like permease
MAERAPSPPPSRAKVIAAFAAVYLIWGSTYLAIRFAIETVPPFLMAAVRFLIAGAVLYLWVRMRGATRPSRQNWLAALVVGGLLLFVGNGAVVWSEQHVPSGIVSLLVATVPLWVVLLEWVAPGGRRPTPGVVAGIAIGLAGLGLLVGPDAFRSHGVIPIAGALVLLVASIAWATGSVLSRKLPLPKEPLLATAMEMLAGGALLSGLSLATAEWRDANVTALSTTSVVALLYLIVFGSLIGFTAYIWLLGASSPARASTYAYVNPVVALFLGWMFANEPISARTLIAAAIIIAAVVLITAGQHGQEARESEPRGSARGRRPVARGPRRVRAGSSG